MKPPRSVLWVALTCGLALAACGDAPTAPNDLPPDTAHGPGLLLAWSELSGRISYAVSDSVFLIDVVRRQVRGLYRSRADETIVDLAASPDGSLLAVTALVTTGGDRTTIIRASSGEAVQGLERTTCPRWLSDGRLSYTRGDTLFVAGAALTTFAFWTCPTWAPDESYFIAARREPVVDKYAGSSVYRVSTNGLAQTQLLPRATDGYGAAWFDPAVAPNGSAFAVVYANDGPDNRIFLANADGSNAHVIASWPRIYGLWWSPDGSQLLGVSTINLGAGLVILRVADGEIRRLIDRPVYAATWSR